MHRAVGLDDQARGARPVTKNNSHSTVLVILALLGDMIDLAGAQFRHQAFRGQTQKWRNLARVDTQRVLFLEIVRFVVFNHDQTSPIWRRHGGANCFRVKSRGKSKILRVRPNAS